MPCGYNKEIGNIVSIFPTCLEYAITINGIIINSITLEKINIYFKEDGCKYVKLPGRIFSSLKNEIELKVAVIIGLAYKTPNFDFKYIELVDMFYLDDDKTNLHPSNLIWKYPIDGIPFIHMDGFYHIPGFSRYVINRKAEIYSLISKRFLKIRKDDNGYLLLGICGDNNENRVILVSRLIALTFIEYDKYVIYKVANHKNLIKIDNSVSNLEWITHRENVNHASLMTGKMDISEEEANSFEKRYGVNPKQLYDNKKEDRERITNDWRANNRLKYKTISENLFEPIERKDLITGEIIEYQSRKLAAESIGCGTANIGYAINKNSPHFAGKDGRYLFKRKSDKWFDVTYADRPVKNGKPRPVICKNNITGNLNEYPNAVKFYTENKLERSKVERLLAKKEPGTINDLTFWYKEITVV